MDQAEQLRNIIKRQSQQRQVARVITVTSGKGGVGKSSISVNLAIQMSKLGKRVIILDADFGLANVEVMLGIRPRYNLADLLFKGKGLKDIITEGPKGIGFISGGSGIQELNNISRNQIIDLTHKLDEIDNITDVIIIDTGAGINDIVLEFVIASTETLLVTTPEPTSLTDSYALLKTLNRKPEFSTTHSTIKMIANRVESPEEGKELFNKLNVVVNKFLNYKIEYLGSIPHDPNVPKAIIQQKPYSILYPNSQSTKAIYNLSNILCENTQEEQKRKGISQLFSYLIHSRR